MLKITKKSSRAFAQLMTGFILLAGLQSIALSKEAPIIDPTSRFHPVYSQSGMVVSQEIIASRVGADILSQGGNAIDAAMV